MLKLRGNMPKRFTPMIQESSEFSHLSSISLLASIFVMGGAVINFAIGFKSFDITRKVSRANKLVGKEVET